jgi:DNA-binding GntR family transcriptional regulator
LGLSSQRMSIVVRTLSDQTYEIVRRRILTGEMPPGTAVRQDTIAAELGVSKIPLREALSRLEQDGLLSSYPNKGYVVRQASTEEASEVFALRLKLEPGAAAEAALKAVPDDHLRAETALAALEAELGKPQGDHVTCNRAFHMALVRPGGHITSQLVERLQILSERYVRIHLEPLGRDERASREHRAILDAWKAGDAARVEALLAGHIEGTLADLRQQLAA